MHHPINFVIAYCVMSDDGYGYGVCDCGITITTRRRQRFVVGAVCCITIATTVDVGYEVIWLRFSLFRSTVGVGLRMVGTCLSLASLSNDNLLGRRASSVASADQKFQLTLINQI